MIRQCYNCKTLKDIIYEPYQERLVCTKCNGRGVKKLMKGLRLPVYDLPEGYLDKAKESELRIAARVR